MTAGRRRRLVQGVWLALALALLVWLDSQLPTPAGVLRADFGVGAAVAVISLLGNLFGLFRGKVDSSVKRGLEGLRGVIVTIGQTLAEFARDTASVFGSVWGFIRKFWDRVLFPLIQRLDRYIVRLFKWLKDTFGPVIEALIWLRAKILAFYAKWLGPIFDTIDVLRRILGIFSLFGLDWSRKLDQKLAELQDALMRPIRLVVEKINQVIDVVDRIVTLDGLLQRITLLRSYARDIRYVWNAWNNSQSKPLTEAERAAAAAAGGHKSTQLIERDFDTYVATGEGPYAALNDELWATIELRLRRGA